MFFLYVWICVQIIVESLPLSSSGHVQLAEEFFNCFSMEKMLPVNLWQIDFLLHGPMIGILLALFFKQWWQMGLRVPLEKKSFFKHGLWLNGAKTILFVGVADVITFLFWVIQPLSWVPLTIGFCLTALSLCSLRYYSGGTRKFNWKYADAGWLGMVQGLSLMPGVSRFASTYAAGCYLGYERREIFALSFMIQFPLLLAAFAKGLASLGGNSFVFAKFFDLKMLFVILSATIISYAVLCWVGRLIERKKLWKLSWYMIVPIVLSCLL